MCGGADHVVTRPGQCVLCPVTIKERAEGLEVRCHTGDDASGPV